MNAFKPFRALPVVVTCLTAILMGGCSSIQLVNNVSKVYQVEVNNNLPVGHGSRLAYDLYLPNKPASQTASTPVIVFFYGGSWNRGSRSEYEFVGRRLASEGYIVAIPDYRLYPEVKYPDFLIDGAKSVNALIDELRNPRYAALRPSKKVVLMGHSAGAYNAAMLAYDPRWLKETAQSSSVVAGFIGLAGAYNIYPIKDQEVQPVFHHPNYPEQSQPIEFVNNTAPASLIVAPEQDTILSTERNSQALHQALTKAGGQSTLVTVSSTDHVTLIGTLSPLLFFKGSTMKPIQNFILHLANTGMLNN
ncbi:alpha/beta hydrolase [Limnobacter sp.]|uniref:alpha/beta hydrolase n=1 Tax=Limnobacter sp. TaxID=2003368 RepID=UPI003513E72E